MRVSRVLGAAASLAVAAWLPAAHAQSFVQRTVNGNGRNVFEVRLGGANTATPGAPASQGLVVAAVTAAPTSGATSLTAVVFDGRTLFDPGATLPVFVNVIPSGQIFSLGGGCQRGNVTEFPFINNGRPQILRYTDSLFTVFIPTIANTDQYDSADCRTSSDGATNYFAFTNRTDSTLEWYKTTVGGFTALPAATTFPNVNTPFVGGIRPAIDIKPLTVSERLQLVYGYNNSPTTTQTMIGEVDPVAGTRVNFCPITVGVRPTAFTRPRESTMTYLPTFSGGITVSVADFDNNGVVDIYRTTAECTTTLTSGGSSNGAAPFNWTGFASAVDARTQSLNVLWGDYFYVDNQANYAVTPASPGPFGGRGGPFAACSAYDVDSGTEIVSVATGTNQAQLQFARGHRDPDKIFQSGMSRSELMAFCVRMFLP